MSTRRGPHIILPGGDGSHVVQFLYWGGQPVPYGLVDRHRHSDGDGFHGGYLAWQDPSDSGEILVRHQLAGGGPDDPTHLSVTPSLACAFARGDGEGEPCTSHGWITEGRWIDAGSSA